MRQLLRDHWPAPILIAGFACLITAAVTTGLKAEKIRNRQKMQSVELQLIAVRAGLGEFYVSTNTATIEFRLKEKP